MAALICFTRQERITLCQVWNSLNAADAWKRGGFDHNHTLAVNRAIDWLKAGEEEAW